MAQYPHMTGNTLEELSCLCAEWQADLRLNDWEVILKLVMPHEMGPERSGECSWVICKKRAKISILDSQYWGGSSGSWVGEDQELTLVHELLHLHYAPFDNFKCDTPEDTALEQSIHCISQALVALKRAKLAFTDPRYLPPDPNELPF